MKLSFFLPTSHSFAWKTLSCICLVLIADLLFYAHNAGWTLGIFAALLLGVMLFHNATILTTWQGKIFAGLAFAQALGFMILPSMLGGAIYGFCIVSLALKLPSIAPDATIWFNNVIRYCFVGWGRALNDHKRLRRALKKGNRVITLPRSRMIILIPMVTGALFIALFANANPIIGNWVRTVDWQLFKALFSPLRMIFWLMTALSCWAIIRPRLRMRYPSAKSPSELPQIADKYFTQGSLVYSLLLFNGLFLTQNMLDIIFIWGSDMRPHGMISHAEYAHQGAYPLIATVLLAAGYVLIALRPEGSTASHPLIRLLVTFWIGQNIFLVFSCISRLYGYVGEYSLTYLRLATFIWIGLVACGLLLIIFRIYFNKSNIWLINWNAAILAMILYGCSFVPFGTVIANFNVNHSLERTLAGRHLDVQYLADIGEEALPALRHYVRHTPDEYRNQKAVETIIELESNLRARQQDWHARTVYGYYLLGAIMDNHKRNDVPDVQ